MGVVVAFPVRQIDPNENEIALSKTVVRASEWLDIDQEQLSDIIAIPRTSALAFLSGDTHLREQTESYNLALDFVAIFNSLHMKFAANRSIAREWMKSQNSLFDQKPISLIRKPDGLSAVKAYVEKAIIP
jgi:hypothetical protein